MAKRSKASGASAGGLWVKNRAKKNFVQIFQNCSIFQQFLFLCLLVNQCKSGLHSYHFFMLQVEECLYEYQSPFKLSDQFMYSNPNCGFGLKFDPTLVLLTHFVTSVGSSNLTYALRVMIIMQSSIILRRSQKCGQSYTLFRSVKL